MIDFNKLHPKINQCLKTMVTDVRMNLSVDFHFYYYFASYLNFIEDKKLPAAAGVTANLNGLFFYYNPMHLDMLEQEEVNFLVIHELFHLIFDHVDRTNKWELNRKLANIAQDFVINELIEQKIEKKFAKMARGTVVPIKNDKGELIELKKLKEDETYEIEIDPKYHSLLPKNDDVKEVDGKLYYVYKYSDNPIWLTMPEMYGDGSRISEYVYFWLLDLKNSYTNKKESYNKGETDELPTTGDPKLDRLFDQIDLEMFFEVDFNNCNVSDSIYKKLFVGNIIQSAKNRGYVTSNVNHIISKLQECKKDYLKELAYELNSSKGFKQVKTYKRPNRKGFNELKGKYKLTNKINCILDTSGSMMNEFEKVLSIIFKTGYEINLIQCDSEVKNMKVVKDKKELNMLEITGLGGTELQPAIDFIKQKKLNDIGTVILTDGYCDVLDISGLKKTLIVTSGVLCKIKKGTAKQIIV
jgi:predicted metal-dependent peptidase